MISDYVNRRLETISQVSQDGRRVKDLYDLLYKKELWLRAYSRIASNKGATTKGPDEVTQDGFSEGRVENLILQLREGLYHSKPVKRVYIPKSNGKARPLGIPSGDEKLLQEVVRRLLECVYEPVFSNDSHGFRPKRSCHTALTHIRSWNGTVWFIEFDIKNYFNSIDHNILVKLLENKIDDKKFIGLIREMLRSGYLEDWKYNRTYSGAPQGGIVSPILANIYLHELDVFMQVLKEQYNQKMERAINPEYSRLNNRMTYRRKQLRRLYDQGIHDGPEVSKLQEDLKTCKRLRSPLPSGVRQDSAYRRLKYCRYADDFILGFIGPKSEAFEIKKQIEQFINSKLKLGISQEKTVVKKASEGIEFLGYGIKSIRSLKTIKKIHKGAHTTLRSINGQIALYVPKKVARDFCKKKGYGALIEAGMKPRPYLVNYSEVEIILLYNAELRGLANYYNMARDVKYKLHMLSYIANYSCLATLAFKHKSSITKMAKRMRVGSGFVWKYNDPKGRGKSVVLWRIANLSGGPKKDSVVDVTPNPYHYGGRTELSARLSADVCEYCHKEGGYLEVHHIRKLKDLKDRPHLKPWERHMIQRNRKTMVLCNHCHNLLHTGLLPDMRYSNDTAKSQGLS